MTPALRVLLANSDAAARDALAALLLTRGHDVRTASDSIEAVHQFEAFRPDVALLCLPLPGMGAAELAGLLRWRGLAGRVVAVAPADSPWDARSASAAGFDGFLRSPCGSREVNAALYEALTAETLD